MLFNILKKDLKRKKVMNSILFLFITLCTVFLASSVSNLMVTTSALDYFAEATQLSDYFIFATNDELTEWLEGHENVTQFEINGLINLGNQQVHIYSGDERRLMTASGEGIGHDLAFSRLPGKLILPLDINNDPLVEIESGQVAITFGEARHHGIETGDVLQIEVKGVTHSFEVTQLVKDIAFLPRLFLNDGDFDEMAEALSISFYTYAINVDDSSAFNNSLNRAMFAGLSTRADAAMFMNTFMVDVMVMVILVLVGGALIAISFVVLRFSIVFTLQEDYKEIGIMKAIGLKDKDVKKIYLVKYLFLAILGAGLGFLLSGPFSGWLMSELRESIAFPDVGSMIWFRLASALIVVLLILTFCLLSTRKLKNFTAMRAIRNGETGERFKRKNMMYLHRRKGLPAVMYLAFNDLLSNMKSYVILLFVFTLGFVGVVMPLNASNTLVPEQFAQLINISASDVYLNQFHFETDPFGGSADEFRTELATIVEYYEDHGMDMIWQSKVTFNGIAYAADIYDSVPVPGITQIISLDGTTPDPFEITRGVEPILDNEVAITENILTSLGVDIGDEINLVVGGVSQSFLITGTYETLFYFGTGIRLSEEVRLHDEARFNIFSIQGDFVDQTDVEGQIERLEEISGEDTFINVAYFIDQNMMDVSIVDTVSELMLIVILLVNVLIITLMSVSFMLRDLKQIALLKSLGFSNTAIRLWQGLRILVVMIASLILGGLLTPAANLLASIPFGIMGTPSLTLSVDVIQVYVWYPLIFVGVTALTLMITTLAVKKVGLQDLGGAD